MSIVGNTYLERGKPVVIVNQWRMPPRGAFCAVHFSWLCQAGQGKCSPGRRSGPRNVLIRREDGELVVRPFRGLRKLPNDRSPTDSR